MINWRNMPLFGRKKQRSTPVTAAEVHANVSEAESNEPPEIEGIHGVKASCHYGGSFRLYFPFALDGLKTIEALIHVFEENGYRFGSLCIYWIHDMGEGGNDSSYSNKEDALARLADRKTLGALDRIGVRFVKEGSLPTYADTTPSFRSVHVDEDADIDLQQLIDCVTEKHNM